MAKDYSKYLFNRFRLAKFFDAIIPALILFFIYYIISLLDLWFLVPDFVQVVVYFIVFVSGLAFFFAAMKNKVSVSQEKMRFRLGLLAVAALTLAISNFGDLSRLNSLAFMPRALFDYPQAIITAEVIPPIYSEKKVVRKEVSEDATGINPVYEGSILDVEVKNARWRPDLELSDGSRIAFTETGDDVYKASIRIDEQTHWLVKQGSHVLGVWPIDVVGDESPVINSFVLLDDHENRKGYIALNVDVQDDRKIMKAAVDVVDSYGSRSDSRELSIRGIKSYDGIFYLDLTGSDAAGTEVDLVLSVEDEAGQVSGKQIEGVVIPEKEYKNPLAYSLISLHKELKDPDKKIKSVARRIKALGLLNDEGLPPVYYMALRTSYWRLVNPTSEKDRVTARDLLWDVAQTLEDSELGPTENELVYALDELSLGIRQEKQLLEIRELLKETDRLFREYRRKARQTVSDNYTLEIDLRALRKLYSYILAFSDQKKHNNASLIVDLMKKALVQNDNLILSRDGLGNYFALFEGRQIIDNLISIQKSLLAISYNDQMKIKLTANNKFGQPDEKTQAARSNEIILQTKVGDAVERLGERISFADDHSGFLIENAKTLVDEILTGMKNSETNRVAKTQSELLAVMSNLKRILNKPVAGAPELKNLLKEISAKPVS